MKSRTEDGKHTKRFIILKKNVNDAQFVRSFNIPEFFATREAAQAAIDTRGSKEFGIAYKVRQK